jgi:hypothetical protein
MESGKFLKYLKSQSLPRRIKIAWPGLILVLFFLFQPLPGAGERAVQIITGRIDTDLGHLYTLAGLKRGDALYVQVQGTSGNFDPMLAIVRPGVDFDELRQAFRAEMEQAVAAGRDLLPIIPELLDKFSLAWNDDYASGYASALKFDVPAAGDYRLLVRSTLANQTYGSYSLIVGLNAPEVLTGQAKDTGRLALLDRKASRLDSAVQEIKGSLSFGQRQTVCFGGSNVGRPETGPVFRRLWRQAASERQFL